MTRRSSSRTNPARTLPNRRAPRPRAHATRNEILDVKVRRSTARRTRNRRISSFLIRFALVIGIGCAGYFGFIAITEKFFLTNPEYNLRTVHTELDELMTHEEALAITGITPGTNIFKIDLSVAERALKTIEQIATVRIERRWPDQISIHLTKRHPVAWLARQSTEAFSAENALLLDAAGLTIKPYRVISDYWRLPVIYCADPALVKSHDPLAVADLKAALALIAENESRPDSLLGIRSIDITRGYAFQITNDSNARIMFSPENPAEQLTRLQRLLEHCAETGRQLESVNLIPTKYTPVQFLMASAQTQSTTEPTHPEEER